ncbi:hypothetical protein [Patulibacter americanus]|uniref:hypothetical protein n=1 Tax=Patulibacter americanus TaxID=588672 RepID=UPI0003B42A22|nr:hypothetical protein [Patulibacter americanus]
MRKRTYTEDEIAAEEQRFGGALPEELRRRYLEGIHQEIVVRFPEDGRGAVAFTLGPSTTTTDKKGRAYPTPGLTQETERSRDLMPAGVLVAWADDESGNRAVVMDDGRVLWWWHDADPGDELEAVEIVWDPSPEAFDAVENGEPLP